VTVYPAIDLRGGRCVRLVEGDFARETVYGDDPVAVARRWEAGGARWIHVVDLDGARAGAPAQLDLVAAICRAVTIPVQVGGGLRDAHAIQAVMDAGVTRAIVGTVAVRDPDLCETLCRAFPGRVVVGIDARDGIAPRLGLGRRFDVARNRPRASGREARRRRDRLHRHRPRRHGARSQRRRGPRRSREPPRSQSSPRAASGPWITSRAVVARAPDGIEGVIVGKALLHGRR